MPGTQYVLPSFVTHQLPLVYPCRDCGQRFASDAQRDEHTLAARHWDD